ncbi:hypothetical protein ABIC60_001800 [Phyllobacterium ifriqiyense]
MRKVVDCKLIAKLAGYNALQITIVLMVSLVEPRTSQMQLIWMIQHSSPFQL